LTNGGIASGFAFGYDPTRRSVVLKLTEYIIRCSMLGVRCSTFISFYSPIRLAVFLARGSARVKLQIND